MAIPTVPTLAVGDKFTAARHNAIVTLTSFLLNPPECVGTNVAGTVHTTSVRLLFPMATEDVDTGPTWDGAMHSTSTNNSRIVATTAGRYRLKVRQSWAANATGRRQLDVCLNVAGTFSAGAVVLSNAPAYTLTAADVCRNEAEVEIDLAANDYLEMFGFQSSGGNLALDTGAGSNYMLLRLIGS